MKYIKAVWNKLRTLLGFPPKEYTKVIQPNGRIVRVDKFGNFLGFDQ